MLPVKIPMCVYLCAYLWEITAVKLYIRYVCVCDISNISRDDFVCNQKTWNLLMYIGDQLSYLGRYTKGISYCEHRQVDKKSDAVDWFPSWVWMLMFAETKTFSIISEAPVNLLKYDAL